MFFLTTAVTVCLLTASIGKVQAQGASKVSKNANEELAFRSISAAYRQGMGAFRVGRMDIAIPALEYAAQKQLLPAQLWIARIYSQGLKETKVNDVKAFEHYQFIANRLADIKYYDYHSRYAAEAFLALAYYHKKGIPELRIISDQEAAARLYQHAALHFRNAAAQYYLGKAYLRGEGVVKDMKSAFRWLSFAAKKNYPPAQAYLGKMLWDGVTTGQTKKKESKAKGLALVRVAFRNAGKKHITWISKLHYQLSSQSDAKLNARANKFVESWQREFGSSVKTIVIAIDDENDLDGKASKKKDGIASKSKEGDDFIKVQPFMANPNDTMGLTRPAGTSDAESKNGFQNLGTVPSQIKK